MVLDRSASWGGSQFWTGDLLHLLQLLGARDVQVELAWGQRTPDVFTTNYLKWVVPVILGTLTLLSTYDIHHPY